MLNSIKSKLAVAGVVVVGAFAVPAMAQGAQWTTGPLGSPPGTPITATTAVKSAFTLTLTSPATGVSVTCSGTDLGTIGTGGTLTISSFTFTVPCSTSLAGCTVTAASATTSPAWTGALTGSGPFNVSVSGVVFQNTFANVPACGSFAGATLHASGSLNGGVFTRAVGTTPSKVTFTNATGLTSPEVGPVTVTGTDTVQLTSGTDVVGAV